MLRYKNTHHAIFTNGNTNWTLLFNTPHTPKTPRNRLQNITESTNIRIKVQLSQPFSRRHNSLFYRAINHYQLAYFLSPFCPHSQLLLPLLFGNYISVDSDLLAMITKSDIYVD